MSIGVLSVCRRECGMAAAVSLIHTSVTSLPLGWLGWYDSTDVHSLADITRRCLNLSQSLLSISATAPCAWWHSSPIRLACRDSQPFRLQWTDCCLLQIQKIVLICGVSEHSWNKMVGKICRNWHVYLLVENDNVVHIHMYSTVFSVTVCCHLA